ncbi:MAG: hypothetical protein ACO3CR_03750 [Solirubrobacterales bacterium]
MAIVVWLIVGVALWHLTIFVPDRFWQGIVGALLGAIVGAMVTGALVQILLGRSLGDTDLLTFFAAIPGFLIGVAVVYWIGTRAEPPTPEPDPIAEVEG